MEGRDPGFLDYLAVFWKYRRPAAWNFAVILALGILVSLVLPAWYEARTSVLPPDESSEISFFSPMAEVQSFLPFSVPGLASPSDVLGAIMESQAVMERIVDTYDLTKAYKKKRKSDAIRKLRKHTTVEITDVGIVIVKVEDKEPERAAAMAASFVEILDEFNREKRMTQGKRIRMFVENQLKEAEKSLVESEEALQEFQETHSTVAVNEQTQVAIEAAAGLAAEIAALEVRENLLKNFLTPAHPELISLRTRRLELSGQIREISGGADTEDGDRFYVPLSSLPAVGMEMARLRREVRIQTEVYSALVDIYQRAKIQEAKDTPTVQVLDRALPPDRRARPRRTLIVLLAAVIGLAGSVALAFTSNWMERAREAGHPVAKSWDEARRKIKDPRL